MLFVALVLTLVIHSEMRMTDFVSIKILEFTDLQVGIILCRYLLISDCDNINEMMQHQVLIQCQTCYAVVIQSHATEG